MIPAKQDLEEITAWDTEIGVRLNEVDREVKRLKDWVDDGKSQHKITKHKDQIEFEAKLHETSRLLESSKQNSKWLNQNTSPRQKSTSTSKSTKRLQAMLPKFIIGRLDETYMDWPRFLGLKKLSTRKEFQISLSLRTCVNCSLTKLRNQLKRYPSHQKVTTEKKVYWRVNMVKNRRSWKRTKDNRELPHISNVNINKIHEFCEKPTSAVQSLAMMGSLEKITGNVAMTLDKLSGIRGDLVRSDPE